MIMPNHVHGKIFIALGTRHAVPLKVNGAWFSTIEPLESPRFFFHVEA